jgi:hypothetical protein
VPKITYYRPNKTGLYNGSLNHGLNYGFLAFNVLELHTFEWCRLRKRPGKHITFTPADSVCAIGCRVHRHRRDAVSDLHRFTGARIPKLSSMVHVPVYKALML